MDEALIAKKQKLDGLLTELGSVAVAFSSGVDSTFLLKAAHQALGENAVALTVRSCLSPAEESSEAEDFCRAEGISHIMLDIDPLTIDGFSSNPPDRCYICKTALFSRIIAAAGELGIKNIAEGSNTDDLGDYRPGMRAISELGVISPLRLAGLSKNEIRELSKELGLSTWDKPSYACLATRFVYGETIDRHKLSMVEEAERLLHSLGFRQARVRVHGNMARLEILPAQFDEFWRPDVRERVYGSFTGLGFDHVSLDLAGYRTGSMNKALERSGK